MQSRDDLLKSQHDAEISAFAQNTIWGWVSNQRRRMRAIESLVCGMGGGSSHAGAIAMVDERPQLDVATFASADLWMKVQLFLVSIGRMICSRC